jgi:plasmid stabilization system protein ParE
MKYQVLIQPPAQADIEAAYLYLRERSESAADRWLGGMESAIASLDSFPQRHGLAREDREFPEEIRQLLYGRRSGRFRVLYVVRGKVVHVLHVRHAAQRALQPGEIESD